MNEKTCKAIVLERARGRSELSGKSWGYFSYHHRLKRSQGGEWSPENVVYVTGTGTTGEHGWIEGNPNDAHALGFHCRPWEDPAETPVLLHGLHWVRLSNCFSTYDYIDKGE